MKFSLLRSRLPPKGSGRRRKVSRGLDLALIPPSGTLPTQFVLSTGGRPRPDADSPEEVNSRQTPGESASTGVFIRVRPPRDVLHATRFRPHALVSRLRDDAVTWRWTQVDKQILMGWTGGSGRTSESRTIHMGWLEAPWLDFRSGVSWLHGRPRRRQA